MKKISIFAILIFLMFSGCSSSKETLTVINPKGPFQCARDGNQFDCISKKELERLIESEKYWQSMR